MNNIIMDILNNNIIMNIMNNNIIMNIMIMKCVYLNLMLKLKMIMLLLMLSCPKMSINLPANYEQPLQLPSSSIPYGFLALKPKIPNNACPI
jgi:hypothetical protein